MDRRRQSRVFVDLPVQIWGMDSYSRPFMQPASLRTISGRGATLQCVDARLKPGDVVDVLYEGTKAQFRIVWCGKPGNGNGWRSWSREPCLAKSRFGMSIHSVARRLRDRGKNWLPAFSCTETTTCPP